MSAYLAHVLVVIAIYTTAAAAAHLLLRTVGLVSLAHGAILGAGAYVAAICSTRLSVGVSASILMTVPVGLLCGVGLSMFARRMTSDHFTLATLGLSFLFFDTATNLVQVTNGPFGIAGVQGFKTSTSAAVGAVAVALVVVATIEKYVRLPVGQFVTATQDDDTFVRSLGGYPWRFQVVALALSGACAAVAGGLYAHLFRFVDPVAGDFGQSVAILTIALIASTARTPAVALAAGAVVLAQEILRIIGVPLGVSANLREIAYGALIVALAGRGDRAATV